MPKLPAYYHQSTILTLDDDLLFSQVLARILRPEFVVKTFNEPETFIEYVNHYQSPLSKNNVLRDCSEHNEYDTASHALVDLDVPALHSLQHNQERHDEVSVVIVDYHMPNLTGLEVCHKLNKLKAKKILLTGASDQQIAIDAFNNNLIDKFIRKDSPTIAEEIMTYVRTLAKEYYIEQTTPIVNHLEASKSSPLSDTLFATFFQQWCKEHHIKEYTLIDKNGGFCVIDQDDHESYFILHTDHSLNTFMNVIDDIEDATPYLKAIQSRELIPFFGVGIDSWTIEPSAWNEHYYPANLFTGRENYYWSVVASQADNKPDNC